MSPKRQVCIVSQRGIEETPFAKADVCVIRENVWSDFSY